MKKFIALFLFSIASMSFQLKTAENKINWKKELYWTSTVIAALATTSSISVTTSCLWVKNLIIPLAELSNVSLSCAINGKNSHNFIEFINLGKLNKLSKISNELIFYGGIASTLCLAYLTKKSYDKYQEEVIRDKNKSIG